jgi:hypothetical protein
MRCWGDSNAFNCNQMCDTSALQIIDQGKRPAARRLNNLQLSSTLANYRRHNTQLRSGICTEWLPMIIANAI